MTSISQATGPLHSICVGIMLPESQEPIVVRTSLRSSPRMISEQLIDEGLLDDQLRYSCRFIAGVGRVLDSYMPLREQEISDGDVIRMEVRELEPTNT